MIENTTVNDFGQVTESATLRIQRLLPGPVERVWAYLTESELRRQWLAAGDMTLAAGAPFEFVWRNDELSDSPVQRPARFPEEQRMHATITEVDPPHRISFTWVGTGDVTFELEPRGEDVLLTVTHRQLPDRTTLVQVAAGWHMHLDILAARAHGRNPEPFWPGWSGLHEAYDGRLPA